MIRILLLIAIIIIPDFVDAQSFYRRRQNRYIVVSAGSGTSTYYGELKNDGLGLDTKLNFEAGIEYKLNPRFSPKVMLTYFRLIGDDALADDGSRKRRNLSFKSDNIELSAVAMFQLFEDPQRYYQRRPINFYGFIGIGLLWFNPKAIMPDTDWNGNPLPDAGKVTSLKQYQTEGVRYSSFGVVLPFGLGIRFRMNPWINISIDGGYRKTFTDYLDDVSTVHPGIASFSDPAAAALSDRRHELDLNDKPTGFQRGNPDDKDGYFIMNVKVEYYLQSIFGQRTGVVHRRSPKRR